MNKNELKERIYREIDRRKEELIELGIQLWKNPEPGYEEFKSAARIEHIFASLNLPIRSKLARTGVRADLQTGKPGPTVAILGELDALLMPEHPEADPQTHAAHACGHNMQITALAGAAMALSLPEVREHLSGSLAFIACPAEECRIGNHLEEIKYLGGKAELIRLGVFDDVDMAFMTHANNDYGAARTSNGFVMKKIVFRGQAAHAGRPWMGVNALSAARIALDAVDAQRDTFRDEDTVRIHGIVKNGGSVVNIVPEEVELEYQIRAQTPEAIRDAADKFDRSMRGAALSFGLDVSITTFPGYMPLYNEPELLRIHLDNLRTLKPDVQFVDFGRRTSSTDMGDVSAIMPAMHPYSGGWTGVAHSTAFHWQDEAETFVEPAKVLAADAVDLLFGDAENARRIATIKPRFTRKEYLDFLDSFIGDDTFRYSVKK